MFQGEQDNVFIVQTLQTMVGHMCMKQCFCELLIALFMVSKLVYKYAVADLFEKEKILIAIFNIK